MTTVCRKRGARPVLVTGYSCFHPSPRLRVMNHPPTVLRPPPPARIPPTQTVFARGPGAVGIHTTDATNYLILSILGRWVLNHPSPRLRVMNHPGPTTHENCIFAGPGIVPPLRRGELYSATVRAKFPSIGGVAACRRGGKRVRIYPLTPLCHRERSVAIQ